MLISARTYIWLAVGALVKIVHGVNVSPYFANATTPTLSYPIVATPHNTEILVISAVQKDLGDPTQPLPIPPLSTPNALSALLPALKTIRSSDVATCWPCDWPSTAVIPGIAPTSATFTTEFITSRLDPSSTSSDPLSVSEPTVTSSRGESVHSTVQSTLWSTSYTIVPSSFTTATSTALSSDLPTESITGGATSSWPPPDWVAPAPTANGADHRSTNNPFLAGTILLFAMTFEML
ncbi:hypothetical protein EJ05DRAFT_542321 [Pseudovirgaria hyperparasitica]|uniref:Uncharacterized protein n=1 Tax=Pseudovirgaria hyperparasitica TaxID=470096 RepID=A0A6A6VUC7_9PEZI|nr:uncharacterized protein EJ05DRAFT_542321 [Pseudovirgaria hyperparasitica]KAF2752851.1 hypothetical protein EJ05DRAFT_542321 [Pseudovirgaria hyperparasitica]